MCKMQLVHTVFFARSAPVLVDTHDQKSLQAFLTGWDQSKNASFENPFSFLILRPDDSRNFKRPFAEKRPRTDILNPGSLHLVGAFAFGGRF